MKTDPIFYRLFQELPSSFFEMIGRPASEASAYRFDSVEVKQTAFRIDGLFLPKIKPSKKPPYFLEIQFYKDPNIYASLFAEVFIYLDKNDPTQDWRAVVVYQKRSQEPDKLKPYQELLNSEKVIRVYLDELDLETPSSLGLDIVKLVVTPEGAAAERAKQLIGRATQDLTDKQQAQNVVELIETIVLYKFPSMSREELETMLGLDDLKQTKFAREMLEEGKQEAQLQAVPWLLASGLSVEQIAQGFGLTVEVVQQAAERQAEGGQ